jgi:homogentisate 1,2-dioxygenase
MEAQTPPPNVDLYTRNGFGGPWSTIIKAQYGPAYSRVEGTYAPRRLNVSDLADVTFADQRVLPVPLLAGDGVSVEAARRAEPMACAVRNVFADEVHYLLSGRATLETDFGVLQVRAGDFVVIPRGVSYRLSAIAETVAEVIAVSASELRFDPEGVPGVINPDLHVDAPVPYDDPVGTPGEYEVVIRHGDQTTSYFYDYDPLRCLATAGAPQVLRFNIESVQGWGVPRGGMVPPRLINDASTRTLLFYLGARRSDRPPIHHNVDYDEVIVYCGGPGHYGAVTEPGTITWTPKGILHQGPEEDVPEGYQAWLFETRAPLSLTPAGQELARLMETSSFDIHPMAEQAR